MKQTKKKCPICKCKHQKRTICCKPECNVIRRRKYFREWHQIYDKTPKGRQVKAGKGAKRLLFEKSTVHNFTRKQWRAKLKRSKGICKQCKRDVGIKNLTLDHRYPVSKAYKDFKKTGIKRIYTIRSIDAICGDCNSTKGSNL